MNQELIKIITIVISALLTLVVGLLLYFLKKKDDELNLIKNKISEEKYKTYFDVISLFFDMLKDDKGLTQTPSEQYQSRYINIKKNLLLLGSDEIIRKFTEFDKAGGGTFEEAGISKISLWLDLYILIRKDSGNPKSRLTTDDILKSIIKSEDYPKIQGLIKAYKKNI